MRRPITKISSEKLGWQLTLWSFIILLTLTWVGIEIFFDEEGPSEYVGADFEIEGLDTF